LSSLQIFHCPILLRSEIRFPPCLVLLPTESDQAAALAAVAAVESVRAEALVWALDGAEALAEGCIALAAASALPG
jgi:hypothetical protein